MSKTETAPEKPRFIHINPHEGMWRWEVDWDEHNHFCGFVKNLSDAQQSVTNMIKFGVENLL